MCLPQCLPLHRVPCSVPAGYLCISIPSLSYSCAHVMESWLAALTKRITSLSKPQQPLPPQHQHLGQPPLTDHAMATSSSSMHGTSTTRVLVSSAFTPSAEGIHASVDNFGGDSFGTSVSAAHAAPSRAISGYEEAPPPAGHQQASQQQPVSAAASSAEYAKSAAVHCTCLLLALASAVMLQQLGNSASLITITGATGVLLVSYLIPVANHFALLLDR